jgi:hypothetical protein
LKHHPTARELLADIERYCHKYRLDPTTFGRDAMNDGNFIPRLRAGRTPRLQTIDRVRAYISGKRKRNGRA